MKTIEDQSGISSSCSISSYPKERKWKSELKMEILNAINISSSNESQFVENNFNERFETELINEEINKMPVTLFDLLKKNFTDISKNLDININNNNFENNCESTKDNSISTSKNKNLIQNILKCKCDSSNSCQKCLSVNFCFSEEFTKILMNILENSIKEEVVSMLVTNSLRNLSEKRIKTVISELDLKKTINSYFKINEEKPTKDVSLNKIKKSMNESIDKNEHIEKMLNKKRNVKSTKSITACPHVEMKHYAKNMCYNCYHREGRAKKAWNCEHRQRSHYAHGMCHNCYQTTHLEKIKQIYLSESK